MPRPKAPCCPSPRKPGTKTEDSGGTGVDRALEEARSRGGRGKWGKVQGTLPVTASRRQKNTNQFAQI
jgi:hypothetical protein